jgi:N-acetylmuramoyl-L-alanine amidase
MVSKVRWGQQTDAYRAVIDISSQTGVEIKESPNRYEVVFSGASALPINEKSPWSPLEAEAVQSAGNAAVTFKHSASRVQSFWVQDPPRYVVDFYFSGAPASAETARPAVPSRAPGTIETFPSAPPQGGRARKRLVVVDAGHGGHDPGALGNGLKEKDINLKAALELTNSLKNLGIDVKLTRTDDRYLKLAERTEIANNTNADVFISLHCNALPKGKHASGVEFYLMAEPSDKDALNLAIQENKELSGGAQNSAEADAASDRRTRLLLQILGDMQQNGKINDSTTLAEFLYNRARGAGFSLRKVRQAPFFVLRGAGMPALLIEMGYITEAKDANNLNSQAFRKKMADAIAVGIRDYLNAGPNEGGN